MLNQHVQFRPSKEFNPIEFIKEWGIPVINTTIAINIAVLLKILRKKVPNNSIYSHARMVILDVDTRLSLD